MTTFSLMLSEETLRTMLSSMQNHQASDNQEVLLQISITVVPDGIDLKVFNPQTEIITLNKQPTIEDCGEIIIPQAYYDAFQSNELDL